MEIKSELDLAAIPVIAPVALGQDGKSYNINADWAASRIAAEMGVEKLIFVTDQDGILDHDKKLLTELDAADLQSLVENGTVSGGMLAKAKTILHAIEHGVTNVHIINGQRPHALVEELFTESGVGTICRRRSRGLGFSSVELTQ